MASVKEMRTRIGSVKSTQKITKALQMVAAAKLRRAQTAAEAARPYARGMANVIANLAAGVSGPSAPLLLAGTGSDKRHLVIVATSDRGLAGGFNSGIVRAAREKISGLLAEGKDVKIITIGRKARDQLKRTYRQSLYRKLRSRPQGAEFRAGQADRATRAGRLYRRRIRCRDPDLFILQVGCHPDAARAAVDPGAGRSPASGPAPFYDYEPDEGTILEALLPQNISVQLLTAMLENSGRLLRRRR